jgi:hypothetical protein
VEKYIPAAAISTNDAEKLHPEGIAETNRLGT